MGFRNMKIGTRLGGGFAVLLALMIVLVTTGTIGVGSMKAKLTDVVDNGNASIRHATQVVLAIDEILLNQPEMIMAKDEQTRLNVKNRIEKAREDYKNGLEALGRLAHTDKERRQIEDIKGALGSARTANNKMIELALAGKTNEAMTLYVAEVRPLGTKVRNIGMEMVKEQEGLNEARRLISGVRPPILDESGLVAAIAHLVHDPSAVETPKVEFQSKVRFQRLPSIVENAVYRIVQEGLSNARRHSRSSHVRIALVQRGTRLRIEIRDWGVGFNPRRMKKNHYGLAGIRERVRLLGGKCRIRSAPGQGASVTVDLPLPSARDDAE